MDMAVPRPGGTTEFVSVSRVSGCVVGGGVERRWEGKSSENSKRVE